MSLAPNPNGRRYSPISLSSSPSNLLPPQRFSNSSFGSDVSPIYANFARSPISANPPPEQDLTLARQISISRSISEKYSLAPDPRQWGTDLLLPEPDDDLHNPDRLEKGTEYTADFFTRRGAQNLGCLIILVVGLLALFAGYPLASYFTRHPLSTLGGFNVGGINSTGQISSFTGNWGLVDLDTPQEAYTIQSFSDPSVTMELVFSDEFNVDGRTFYPGDDPYWEAVDLNYWQTGDLEWYDPSAITTANGALEITLTNVENHGLNYMSGMMSTWNKFCFTGGLVLASVTLPGSPNVSGLWPAVWSMGNLGRAGYGASLEGMWPYTYDACDVGTVANQTVNGLPSAATVNGDPANGGVLSFLPGQRLSRCTCSGESHPGPVHEDGTYVGRSAPEIDMFEALIGPNGGQISQSAQWGPFNEGYHYFNTSANVIIPNATETQQNQYLGGVFQQATSGLSSTNSQCYELTGQCFSTYGFEYKPGFDDAYISWIANDQVTWQLNAAAMAADTVVEISARPVSQEPMYLITNLGISPSFGFIDLEHLTFPTKMRIDWIRVYQPEGQTNIGCDPQDFPTQAYINEYEEAYTNPNLTTWHDDFGQPYPKNSFLGQC